MKVLIIDDSEVIRERLSNLLNEVEQVEIVGLASCATEGIEMVNSCHPDFIVLDIRLPDKSGIEVLKQIKDSNPETCIAMLTNYPYLPYRNLCMAYGADYFFDKSFEFTQTRTVLQELAGNITQN